MGAGGVIVPPKGYFEKMMAVCQRYDVFMIADEVICAFGRLGEWFGSSALGYKPNSISIAKALTSAYMPVGAILIPEEMYQATIVESKKVGTFGHGFTYSGHPVGAAVALKTLEIYDREKIIEKAAAKSPQFQAHLKALGDHPLVGEARGLGMMGALEMVADKRTKKAFEPKAGIGAKAVAIAQEEGVILRNLGDALALCPPLIISPEEIDDLFDRVARTLDRVLDHVTAEGLLTA